MKRNLQRLLGILSITYVQPVITIEPHQSQCIFVQKLDEPNPTYSQHTIANIIFQNCTIGATPCVITSTTPLSGLTWLMLLFGGHEMQQKIINGRTAVYNNIDLAGNAMRVGSGESIELAEEVFVAECDSLFTPANAHQKVIRWKHANEIIEKMIGISLPFPPVYSAPVLSLKTLIYNRIVFFTGSVQTDFIQAMIAGNLKAAYGKSYEEPFILCLGINDEKLNKNLAAYQIAPMQALKGFDWNGKTLVIFVTGEFEGPSSSGAVWSATMAARKGQQLAEKFVTSFWFDKLGNTYPAGGLTLKATTDRRLLFPEHNWRIDLLTLWYALRYPSLSDTAFLISRLREPKGYRFAQIENMLFDQKLKQMSNEIVQEEYAKPIVTLKDQVQKFAQSIFYCDAMLAFVFYLSHKFPESNPILAIFVLQKIINSNMCEQQILLLLLPMWLTVGDKYLYFSYIKPIEFFLSNIAGLISLLKLD